MAEPAADRDYLRYAHPPVTAPFRDGVNLAVPAELGDPRTAALGWVDVTKAPFLADPTGTTDATRALQQAIDFARDHQMICFFPPGAYRVSDTLECVQQLYRRTNGRVFGAPLWPCVLMGSRAGPGRPRLLLAPRSPGFGDPLQPKYVVRFWARGYANPTTADRATDGRRPDQEQSNISMNQMFVNLDLTIGEGNGGAVALRHQAAEGSAIEDCTIDATHGLTGIEGGIGSGGSSANVTVIGGRTGLDLRTAQPTPVITGFTLIGQRAAAIRYSGRQALVAVGRRQFALPVRMLPRLPRRQRRRGAHEDRREEPQPPPRQHRPARVVHDRGNPGRGRGGPDGAPGPAGAVPAGRLHRRRDREQQTESQRMMKRHAMTDLVALLAGALLPNPRLRMGGSEGGEAGGKPEGDGENFGGQKGP